MRTVRPVHLRLEGTEQAVAAAISSREIDRCHLFRHLRDERWVERCLDDYGRLLISSSTDRALEPRLLYARSVHLS